MESRFPEHEHVLVEALELGASAELQYFLARGLCAHYGVEFLEGEEDDGGRVAMSEAARVRMIDGERER